MFLNKFYTYCVCFLGISTASIYSLPTFRNHVSVPSSKAGSRLHIDAGEIPKKHIQYSNHGESLKSRNFILVYNISLRHLFPCLFCRECHFIWNNFCFTHFKLHVLQAKLLYVLLLGLYDRQCELWEKRENCSMKI
jgi:hypothetical protein